MWLKKTVTIIKAALKNRIRISRIISLSILFITGFHYTQQLLYNSSEKISTVGLSAFAIIGAIAALCFSLSPCLKDEEDKSKVLYAGEKFFHACLLIIQTIFLKYATEHGLDLLWVKDSKVLSTIVFFILLIPQIVIVVISLSATYACMYGFMVLDGLLWNRYDIRMRNKKSEKNKENEKVEWLDDTPI